MRKGVALTTFGLVLYLPRLEATETLLAPPAADGRLACADILAPQALGALGADGK